MRAFLILLLSACVCFGQGFTFTDVAFMAQQITPATGGGGGPVYGDVTAAWVSADGWSFYLAMAKGAQNNIGAFNLGIEGSTNRTGTPSLVLTVYSPGYNTDGTTNITKRTVYGQVPVRLAYSSNTSIDQTGTASAVTNRFALSEPIYVFDSSITLSVAANSYSNCVASSGVVVTNNSVLDYPKTLGKSLDADWQLVGSNYNLRVFGYSNVGTNQYHAIAYQAISSDQHGNWYTSAVLSASSITKPATNTTAAMPYTYAAIPMSCAGFTVGDYITNYWIVYPTIGNTTNTLNTMSGPTSDLWVSVPGRPYAHPTVFVCDRLGNYGGYALVNAGGNDTSGRVVLTNTIDWTAPPPAFLTYAAAKAALRGTNAQTYMAAPHDDYCGTIYMGNGNWPYASTSTSVTNQHGYMTVLPTPTNAAAVVFNSSGTFGGNAAMRICLSNITWTANVGSAFYNYNAYFFKDCTFSGITGSGGAFIELGVVHAENCTFYNWDQGLFQFSTDYTVFERVIGCKVIGLFGSSGQRSIQPYFIWGNILAPTNTFGMGTATYPGTNYPDGCLVGFNYFSTNVSSGTINGFYGSAQSCTNGGLWACNVQENILSDATGSDINLFVKADDATGTLDNWHALNNVSLGKRWNYAYNWSTSTSTGIVRNCSFRGNILTHLASKHDSESPGGSARTNAWSMMLGVSCNGNVLLDQTNYIGSPTGLKTFYQAFSGINSYHPPFTAAWPTTLDPPQGQYANDYSVFGFKNFQAWMGRSTNNVGGGDYHLATGSYFSTAFPGSFALPFDLDGNAYTSSSPPGAYATTK